MISSFSPKERKKMEDDLELPLKRVELGHGVWRLIPTRPYHARAMQDQKRQSGYMPLKAAHHVAHKGMYPEIDKEIDQIQCDVSNYKQLKKEKDATEKPLEAARPSQYECLAAPRIAIRPPGFTPQDGHCIEMFDVEVSEVPDTTDWLRGNPRHPQCIRILLADDYLSRKKVKWDLVPYEEFVKFLPLVENVPQTPFEKIHAVTSNEEKLYVIESKNSPIIGHHTGDDKFARNRSFIYRDQPISMLYERFPFLPNLFSRHRGRIVVAGGSITRLFFDTRHKGAGPIADVDIFFYGLIGKQPSESDIEKAEAEAALILKDCVATLCTLSPYYFRVEKKEYVTNVYVMHPDSNASNGFNSTVKCYQFVMRLYPSKDSIIGGFDLPPSMLLYDGENIYGTELGAWSIVKHTFPIDTTRRSLTYEKRIYKYWSMGFDVVFPGIRDATIDFAAGDPDFDYDATVDKIEALFRSLGIVPVGYARDEEGYARAIEGAIFYGDDFKREVPPVKVSDLRILPKKRIFQRGGKSYDDKPFDATHWVARTSDYNDEHLAAHRIDAAASACLRCNNLDAVFTYFSRDVTDDYYGSDRPDTPPTPISYSDAYAAFENLVANPMVIIDPYYRDRVEWLLTTGCIEYIQSRYWNNYFAEFGPRIRELYKQEEPQYRSDFISRVVTILEERMKVNLPKCEERLKGLKWITHEPGRQWTSSNKPIREPPVDFYGVKYYTPFQLGMPEPVETTLRSIRMYGQVEDNTTNWLAKVPRDVFNMILKMTWRSYVYNIMKRPANLQLHQPPVNVSAYPQFTQPGLFLPGFQQPQMIGVPAPFYPPHPIPTGYLMPRDRPQPMAQMLGGLMGHQVPPAQPPVQPMPQPVPPQIGMMPQIYQPQQYVQPPMPGGLMGQQVPPAQPPVPNSLLASILMSMNQGRK